VTTERAALLVLGVVGRKRERHQAEAHQTQLCHMWQEERTATGAVAPATIETVVAHTTSLRVARHATCDLQGRLKLEPVEELKRLPGCVIVLAMIDTLYIAARQQVYDNSCGCRGCTASHCMLRTIVYNRL
jgi:short subunit dehydrogenase-like uncharacterized protein